jgi:hypothetical protein
MSWTFGGIYIRKDFSADWSSLLERLGLKESQGDETTTWSESIHRHFESTALGTWNGCTMLHDQDLVYGASYKEAEAYTLDERCERLSGDGDVLCFLLDGITSTGAFTWYHAGRRVRVYNNISGALETDSGALLPPETGRPGQGEDPEERVMAVLEFMVGTSFQEMLRVNPQMIICR